MIAHRKIDDTEGQQDECDFHRRRKPLPDSTENEKEGESIHVGTVHVQPLAKRECHFRDACSFCLYTKRQANT
jgi:hypothetical protein